MTRPSPSCEFSSYQFSSPKSKMCSLGKVHFYIVAGKPLCRCDEHRIFYDKSVEVDLDTYLVAQVHDS